MKHLNDYSDEKLMILVQGDNTYAFNTLYNRYVKRLYKFVISILKSDHDTENVIQEVFLKLWINRTKIVKCASVRYYIFTIAHNESITLIKQRLDERSFIKLLDQIQDRCSAPVDIEIEYDELMAELNGIINSLPEQQKTIYKLHKIEGLKYVEISHKLNISVNTIETHMSRALKTIRRKYVHASSLPAILMFILRH